MRLAALNVLVGPDQFAALQRDARAFIPGLEELQFRPIGGAGEGTVLTLVERGLPGATTLQEASYGSIRALALLALLYDPAPPRLTCVEEIDHGLHPTSSTGWSSCCERRPSAPSS